MKIKKTLLTLWVGIGVLFGCNHVHAAEPSAASAPVSAVTKADSKLPTILYLSQYHSSVTPDLTIYGVFNQNGKPSLKIPVLIAGGNFTFILHGNQRAQRFMVQPIFEDAQGNAIGDPPAIVFTPPTKSEPPEWFTGLEHIVGMSATQAAELTIPPGTAAIDLIGEPDPAAPAGGKLLGFISDIQVPGSSSIAPPPTSSVPPPAVEKPTPSQPSAPPSD